MKIRNMVLLLAMAQTGFTHAAVYKFTTDKGKVSFLAKGWPNFLKIDGEGAGVAGDLKEDAGKISGELTFKLDTLNTKIATRDDHMKNKYLEVAKFPQAVLIIDKVAAPAKSGKFPFTGKLKLHGQEQAIGGEAELKESGGDRSLIAEFPLKLSEFKIEIPSFQGITVAEDVKVKFESPVTKKD